MQLLVFSALAFAVLMRTGIYPPELRSVNLDFDWFYRKLGRRSVLAVASALDVGFGDGFLLSLHYPRPLDDGRAERHVLIDCGWNTDDAYGALEEGMKEHGAQPSEITKLVITHVHPDHYGMAGRLKQLSSCRWRES
jgi:glyoxylase-like metal-dependent hydrolase (beta-lactamase superfamily II)